MLFGLLHEVGLFIVASSASARNCAMSHYPGSVLCHMLTQWSWVLCAPDSRRGAHSSMAVASRWTLPEEPTKHRAALRHGLSKYVLIANPCCWPQQFRGVVKHDALEVLVLTRCWARVGGFALRCIRLASSV